MLQDLAVVPILMLIGVLARGSGDGAMTLALVTMAKAGGAIALIYLVGGRVIHPLFKAFARHRQPDVFMALILLSTFGIAGLSAAAGLSMALGALIAGLLLAETEFRHEVELMVEPFKGLLMGLFFMTVGMSMDTRQIADAPLWLAGAVLGLVLIKGAGRHAAAARRRPVLGPRARRRPAAGARRRIRLHRARRRHPGQAARPGAWVRA